MAFFHLQNIPLPHGGRAATQGDFPLGALTEQSPLALIIFNIQYLDSDSDYWKYSCNLTNKEIYKGESSITPSTNYCVELFSYWITQLQLHWLKMEYSQMLNKIQFGLVIFCSLLYIYPCTSLNVSWVARARSGHGKGKPSAGGAGSKNRNVKWNKEMTLSTHETFKRLTSTSSPSSLIT